MAARTRISGVSSLAVAFLAGNSASAETNTGLANIGTGVAIALADRSSGNLVLEG